MMTYQISDSIKEIASGGEFNEFDLNEFFVADGNGHRIGLWLWNFLKKWQDFQ